MIEKTMTYTDFKGNKRTEIFCFHITPGEYTRMELENIQAFKDDNDNMTFEGGFLAKLQAIATRLKGKELLEVFDKILSTAYGIKSEDGRRFIKSEELWEEFTQTQAYSDLLMEFFTSPTYAGEFLKGVIPVEALTSATEK